MADKGQPQVQLGCGSWLWALPLWTAVGDIGFVCRLVNNFLPSVCHAANCDAPAGTTGNSAIAVSQSVIAMREMGNPAHVHATTAQQRHNPGHAC
jgi:hypothetical protein